jgi:hypothetical protein
MLQRLLSKRWLILCAILLAACFCVFVLPFFFPPPYLKGVSVSNVAGFNNKVASVSAAMLSVLVFAIALSWPLQRDEMSAGNNGRISPSLIWIMASLSAAVLSLFSFLIVRSHLLYLRDGGYFIGKISMHIRYGQTLYEQIEFPYGPLLFYSPVAVAKMLSLFHLSITTAYYVTLVAEHVLGLLLVVYLLNSLPMLHKWKTLLFVLCGLGALQLNTGLNYTFLRFTLAPACLVFALRRKQPWQVAFCFFLGEMISLSVSPEMALAFTSASLAYAAFFCFRQGPPWIPALVAPFAGIAVFLLLVNRGYLAMLKLFALGVLNFVVEPLPHTLIFLFALVWLVPSGIALFFRRSNPDAPMLAALYVFSLALLPVAFGREDPIHVLFDGLIVFFLSMVTVSVARPSYQKAWACCVAVSFLWATYIGLHSSYFQLEPVLSRGLLGYQIAEIRKPTLVLLRTRSIYQAEQAISRVPADPPFDVQMLQNTVGTTPVATPFPIPPDVTDKIEKAGLFTPSYYFALVDVYDATAEQRLVDDFNRSQWALLPQNPRVYMTETPRATGSAMGIQLSYPEKRPPYVVGNLFNQNLVSQWAPIQAIGSYEVYRHR